MNKLKVLSIDWDYFVAATASERASLFPDGGNEKLAPILRSIIWASRYAAADSLSEIDVLDTVRSVTDDLAESVRRHTPEAIWVSDSHAPAYQVILDALESTGKDTVDLVNIDFHHDVYGGNSGRADEVNCGSWLRVLDLVMENNDNFYTWVGHEDSDMADWEDFNTELPKYGETRFTTRLSDIDIADTDWDVVFLCRSDMWSPPHLDSDFVDTAYNLIDAVGAGVPVMGQRYVLSDRMDDLTDMIEQERGLREKCKRGLGF